MGKSAQHNCKITDDDFDIKMIKSEAIHNIDYIPSHQTEIIKTTISSIVYIYCTSQPRFRL